MRRDRSDLQRRLKDYGAMASGFVFPDREEKALFARGRAELRRALLPVDDDSAWIAIALLDLQAQSRKDRLPRVRFMVSGQAWAPELGTAGPARPDPLAAWLGNRQSAGIQEGCRIASDPGRFPWQAIVAGLEMRPGRRLASRPLAVALEAPLAALLDFVNHVSWGAARLEIVRLHLEARAPVPRAWLVLRGYYLVRGPSPWAVPEGAGSDDGLLVDPDSPLLWQRIDPSLFFGGGRRELPPAGIH